MISRFSRGAFATLSIVLLGILPGVAAQPDSQSLAQRGQGAFEKGAFTQAADDWHKAVDLFRSQGNTNAEIRTSVSLAGAYESLGQYQSAVQILDGALTRAREAQDRSLIAFVEWKLGAALILTQESERAD